MRYVALLVCLSVATMAHAYNETITSIAYNPSRMGAYDYLKINKKLTLKSGFRAVGNTTEINLYGTVSIVDSNASNHKSISDTESLNMIAKIKPLSNYAADSAGHTFCAPNNNSTNGWLYNPKACSGSTTLEPDTMMGLGPHGYTYTGGSINTSYLIPEVYVYGKNGVEEISVPTSSTKYSRIENIKRMSITGSGSSKTLYKENEFPENLSLTTDDLEAGNSSTEIQVTNTLTLSGMGLNASSAFSSCNSSSQYAWVQRVTDNHEKVKILACK